MPTHNYKLKDGTPVPGCTTICSLYTDREKQDRLMDWAHKLGQQGLDWRTERDNAGDIGTLVHEEIIKILATNDSTQTTCEPVVFNCIKKFMLWWAEQTIRGMSIKLMEQPLISERHRFGGTLDLYAKVEGKHRLIDLKTSNNLYDSFWIQLAGYGILLKENGYKVDEYQILWLPKDNRFVAPIRTDLRKERRIFRNLLAIYYEKRRE